ncbi:MAG: alkaline phosphatase family protein [Prevotella sp.]|jgi:hypothetical protein
MNKYLVILLAVLSSTELQAQNLKSVPKLVVDITIDQLRNDFLEQYASMYSPNGFNKLTSQGIVYESASYPFSPVDPASAIASLTTGSTPHYNNIVGTMWLNRTTLRPIGCVDDSKYVASPTRLATSTIGDELKIATNGSAIVYGIAEKKELAILSAGHAADAAFWIDDAKKSWTTSAYYPNAGRKWIDSYQKLNSSSKQTNANEEVCRLAVNCVRSHAMGRDAATDFLSVTLSAGDNAQAESNYLNLDRTLANFISQIESEIGKDNVLFIVTSTGCDNEVATNYADYKVPTGTFYINRTANLMNIYLSAVYGQGRYVDGCFRNEIFLNRQLIEQKHLSLNEVLIRSQEFLFQNAGVRDVYTSTQLLRGGDDVKKLHYGYNASNSGDIIININPGWQLQNEETGEDYTFRMGMVSFPVIFYGAGLQHQQVSTPITVDRIAPTISKAIQIRAPNACTAEPLF